MELIWREVPNTDLGIDGYLEVVVNGAPIGLIAVQVKSGSSYIESPDETSFVFRAESKHVRYWLSYRLPVMIIIYDPEACAAYWHYIQDYFSEHDDVPRTEEVPIRISKLALFDKGSKEQLVEIASTPDSTAHAMLSLRASRYRYTQELLTQIEVIELYGKRKWLGEWLPLDTEREEILIHSTLARRGPAWFWFRAEANRDYIPYLKSGLRHPDSYVQDESALALAAALERGAVDDLSELLTCGHNVFEVTEALASITDLALDDRRQILKACWQQHDVNRTVWSRAISLRFMSLMAKIGGPEARERIIDWYLDVFVPHRSTIQTGIVRPLLLRNAGCLWDADDLPKLRQFIETEEPGLQDLAVVALAQKGEKQDCDLILSYIEASEWNIGHDDIGWLSKEAAHLFTTGYLDRLRNLIRGPNHSLQALAHRALPALCRRLDEATLLKMLTDPVPAVRSYAAEGLVAIGKATVLLEYEAELLDDTDYGSSISNSAALTSAGDWAVIDKLLRSEDINLHQGVAKGLRLVKGEQTYDCLLALLQSEGIYDTHVHLEAANSLSIIGNEDALSKVLEWLLEHPYERSTNLMASVLVYLDRKLYCPIQWPLKRERDFSILRYSVTRDDYR
jgi:HEAT repeat protein